MPQSTEYQVVVRNPNSWSPVDGLHEMLRSCGHKHKTEAAAENCMSKLVDFNYRSSPSGSWDANWHGAAVEKVREDGR